MPFTTFRQEMEQRFWTDIKLMTIRFFVFYMRSIMYWISYRQQKLKIYMILDSQRRHT